jgi:hypothetical protein
MRTNPTFRAISMIFPPVYFGGLFYYFYHTSGSLQGAEDMGLGPTLLELVAIGLLCSIPLVYGIVRIMLTRRHRPGTHGGPHGPDDGDSSFDADAMIARYLARKAEEESASARAASPARGGGASKPAGFGRRKQ